VRAAQARFRQRHREELNAKRRERYWRDIEKSRAQQRRSNKAYNKKHKDLTRLRNAAYRAKNRDQLLQANRAWRAANIEALRAHDRERSRLGYLSGKKQEYLREWRRRNPDKARAYLRASFHKRRASVGSDSFTAAEWLALKRRYEGCCAYCGLRALLTVDHRIPLSRGGKNLISNILPACRTCNSRKHNRTEDEYRALLRAENRHAYLQLAAVLQAPAAPSLAERLTPYVARAA
jgi:5-methylcytosine-specific restriction endonuclease McrA